MSISKCQTVVYYKENGQGGVLTEILWRGPTKKRLSEGPLPLHRCPLCFSRGTLGPTEVPLCFSLRGPQLLYSDSSTDYQCFENLYITLRPCQEQSLFDLGGFCRFTWMIASNSKKFPDDNCLVMRDLWSWRKCVWYARIWFPLSSQAISLQVYEVFDVALP